MASIKLVTLTLKLVAALESSNGTLMEHPVITNPNSMHYGESAQGVHGMMPKTIAEFGTPERLAKYILKRNGGCPLKASVIQWEQGQNVKVQQVHWTRATAPMRLEKAQQLWKGPIKKSKWAGKAFYGK